MLLVKFFCSLPILLAMLMGVSASVAAQPVAYQEGIHYVVLSKPVPTLDPGKIEVTEIFWYGCPNCRDFEPMMQAWQGGQRSADLVTVRKPGAWNPIMAMHARIYYTAEALGVTAKIHQAAFEAIHDQANPLRTEAQIQELFVSQGVAADAFKQAWDSAAVAAALEQAAANISDYEVTRLPGMVVNGSYLVSLNSAVPSYEEMVKVVHFLIKEVREVRRAD